MTKRVLVLGYTQSGQLGRVLDSISAPLRDSSGIEVVRADIAPREAFPFPWPFLRFFNTFPECVYEEPIALEALELGDDLDFDLIILGYQVWFLSPSLPISSFLQTETAQRLFKGKPVVTVIACRNMWLMAQEKMKQRLAQLGARLVDNIVLTDTAHSATTFISTPLWVLTGKQGPFLGGLIPKAGVPEDEIRAASRFGWAMAEKLRAPGEVQTMLQGLGAVTIQERLIASEQIAHRSFRVWGKALRSLGSQDSAVRKCVLILYILFLILMILTVVPLSAVLKRLFAPLLRKRTLAQKTYYAAPSGEAHQ